MTESHFERLVTSRFGDDAEITFEPLADQTGRRTGTRLRIDFPRDARETYRQSQFMRIAEMVGAHDWEVGSEEDRLALTVETRHALPDEFADDSVGSSRSPHDAYIASLTGDFGAGESGGAPVIPAGLGELAPDSDPDDDG